MQVVKMFRDGRFLGGRGLANEVRNQLADTLERDPRSVVTLDFSCIEGVSHSFADELLTPLSELLGEAFAERVLLVNCAPDVLKGLKVVAEMHELTMPGLVPSDRKAA